MDNKVFDMLKVKNIAYISANSPTQITNWKPFETKISYIENGIKQLETHINLVSEKLHHSYNTLVTETKKTSEKMNNLNIKQFKESIQFMFNIESEIKEMSSSMKNMELSLDMMQVRIREAHEDLV